MDSVAVVETIDILLKQERLNGRTKEILCSSGL